MLAILLTPVFEAVGARHGVDETSPADYVEEVALTPERGAEAPGTGAVVLRICPGLSHGARNISLFYNFIAMSK